MRKVWKVHLLEWFDCNGLNRACVTCVQIIVVLLDVTITLFRIAGGLKDVRVTFPFIPARMCAEGSDTNFQTFYLYTGGKRIPESLIRCEMFVMQASILLQVRTRKPWITCLNRCVIESFSTNASDGCESNGSRLWNRLSLMIPLIHNV